ncbi:hypothetical protein GPECTOR_1g902 [Gonium pectorale]|uniref:Uncharacterized protein n=1 Tax=Gonium pectorale TaxID=33097 RepID=A0A150H4E4_GONPE|nr:hypothetical protein GPECTOR_1g902 [Gonium pectorale]|eukprot:KXZ56999.1 hypothetical protein GPECTOR_1g902 [Gonium pectorale]
MSQVRLTWRDPLLLLPQAAAVLLSRQAQQTGTLGEPLACPHSGSPRAFAGLLLHHHGELGWWLGGCQELVSHLLGGAAATAELLLFRRSDGRLAVKPADKTPGPGPGPAACERPKPRGRPRNDSAGNAAAGGSWADARRRPLEEPCREQPPTAAAGSRVVPPACGRHEATSVAGSSRGDGGGGDGSSNGSDGGEDDGSSGSTSDQSNEFSAASTTSDGAPARRHRRDNGRGQPLVLKQARQTLSGRLAIRTCFPEKAKAVLARGGAQPPGQLRVCGLTVHADLAPAVRSALAAWMAGLGRELRQADPARMQLGFVLPGSEALVSRAVVCNRLARLLGLDDHPDGPLPEGPVLLAGAARPCADPARGGAGLEAAQPLRRSAVLGVVGGFVMPAHGWEEFAVSGVRHCRPEVAARLAAAAVVEPGEAWKLLAAWRLLAGSFRLPLPAGAGAALAGGEHYGMSAALHYDLP